MLSLVFGMKNYLWYSLTIKAIAYYFVLLDFLGP